MAQGQYIQQFDKAYASWKEIDFGQAARVEFGNKGLPDLFQVTNQMNRMLEVVDTVKYDLGNRTLAQLCETLNNVVSKTSGLARMSEADFFANKTRVLNEVQNSFESFREHYPNALALFRTRQERNLGDVDRRLQEAVNTVSAKAESDFERLKEAFTEQVNQLTAANAVKSSSLISQEKIFLEEADLFRKRANRWVAAIIILSLAFFITLAVILRHFCFELSCYPCIGDINYSSICTNGNCTVLYLEIAKAIAYRILVISFLLFIIGVAVRNYYAAMHNYTINKHKANSLAAALTMMNLKLSQAGSDNLMEMAAAAIFSHQPTGYNKRVPADLISKILKRAKTE